MKEKPDIHKKGGAAICESSVSNPTKGTTTKEENRDVRVPGMGTGGSAVRREAT